MGILKVTGELLSAEHCSGPNGRGSRYAAPIFTYLAAFMLFSFLVFPASAAGQQAADPEMGGEVPAAEFGSIPDSLLNMQVYRPDPSAAYFYAFKEVNISFQDDGRSIAAILDYHVRIKVFDADAKQASIIAIPYYFADNVEEVGSIRGFTIQPDGERTSLGNNRVRTINLNARYNVKEFTMPEVRDGSVIEYSYRKKRRFIEELPDFYLSHQAPTAIAKATIENPRYLRYEAVTTDFDGKVRHVVQRIDTSSVPKVFSISQPEPLVLEHWITKDVPAVEEEAFISSLDDYRGKIKFQLKAFGIPRQKLETSWDFVVAQIRRKQDPWQIISRNDRARETGRSIAAAAKNKIAAQDSIFRYLNDRVNYNGLRASYSGEPDSAVLDGRPVNQAAINQVLVSMLYGAEIDAWPMMISTRQFGRINRSFPSFFQFNGQIVYSEIGEKSYFMDASFPHSYPNLIPVQTYNETGLVLKKESYEWSEIRPDKSIFGIRIKVDARLRGNGDLQGSVRAVNYGYPAQSLRKKIAENQPGREIVRNALFDGYTDIRLDSIKVPGTAQQRDSVILESEFMIRNYAASFKDALDYRPMVVGYLMNNPFDDRTRDLPITLDAPEMVKVAYDIKLPDGYGLQEGIRNRSIELPGASLHEEYVARDRRLQYSYDINITRKQFEPELYPQLLDLYERWVKLSNIEWQIKKQ